MELKNIPKITVKKGKRLLLIDANVVTHISCEGYLSTIHTLDGESYHKSKLLKCFEEDFVEFDFFRISRNTIVNTKYIAEIINNHNWELKLVNNIKLKISRRRYYQLIKELA